MKIGRTGLRETNDVFFFSSNSLWIFRSVVAPESMMIFEDFEFSLKGYFVHRFLVWNCRFAVWDFFHDYQIFSVSQILTVNVSRPFAFTDFCENSVEEWFIHHCPSFVVWSTNHGCHWDMLIWHSDTTLGEQAYTFFCLQMYIYIPISNSILKKGKSISYQNSFSWRRNFKKSFPQLIFKNSKILFNANDVL